MTMNKKKKFTKKKTTNQKPYFLYPYFGISSMINEKNLKYPYFRKHILLKKKTMIVHIEICIFAQVFFPSIQFWYNLRSSNIYLLIKEKIPFMI